METITEKIILTKYLLSKLDSIDLYYIAILLNLKFEFDYGTGCVSKKTVQYAILLVLQLNWRQVNLEKRVLTLNLGDSIDSIALQTLD